MRICKEYKKPFIALTQLNREGEKEKREPILADLKDSGAIEQDARFVIALWEDYYTILKNTWGTLLNGRIDWDMSKGNLIGVTIGGVPDKEKKKRHDN